MFAVQVVGVDFGGRLIAIAEEFKKSRQTILSDRKKFDLPLKSVNPSHAVFKQVCKHFFYTLVFCSHVGG